MFDSLLAYLLDLNLKATLVVYTKKRNFTFCIFCYEENQCHSSDNEFHFQLIEFLFTLLRIRFPLLIHITLLFRVCVISNYGIHSQYSSCNHAMAHTALNTTICKFIHHINVRNSQQLRVKKIY